jgi:hypothetical protein
LVAAFAEIGVEAKIKADDLNPAQGWWRTSSQADVYRWEGFIQVMGPEGRWIRASCDSWDSMTVCLKGVAVEREGGFSYLAYSTTT